MTNAAVVFGKYTGGTSGPAGTGKSPVTIGFMNDVGGVPSYPEGTAAAQAAVKLINAHLGGVNGHPVQLDVCLASDAESQGQTCAEQFLAKKLPMIVESNGAIGGGSLHSTLNGKIPVLIANPDSALEVTAKNAFATNAGVFGTDTGYITFAEQLHAKSASLLFPGNDPVGQTAAKQLESLFGKVGIKITPSGFTSNSPDLLPNVIASGATHTDMTIMLTVSPSSCIAGAKALKQANDTKPTIGLFLCISPPVKQGLGDYAPWTYVDTATDVDYPIDPATQGYLAAMMAYAPGTNIGGNAQNAFAAVLGAVRALNRSGGTAATAAKVTADLRADTVGEPMMDPAVKYGSITGLPDLPNLGVRLFKYSGNGKWSDLTGGKWVAPRS